MSLTVDGVWKSGVWASTVWADGVWSEGGAPPVPPPTPAAVSAGWLFPTQKRKTKDEVKQERIKLGILPPEVTEAAVKAVSAVVESRKIPNPEIDLAKAEREMRAQLKAIKKRWMNEYINVLATEYARLEQENTDAQIVMLLFDM